MGLFLTSGLLITGALIVRPTHILMVVLANDLVSMSLTTDRVRPSAKPDRWRVGPMVVCGMAMALAWLAFNFAVFFYDRDILMLDTEQLQTVLFVTLVLIAQANVYLIRERHHCWHSRPSRWMLLATGVDLILVSILALQGIMMAPLSLSLLLQLGVATVLFAILLDFLKVRLFRFYAMN